MEQPIPYTPTQQRVQETRIAEKNCETNRMEAKDVRVNTFR